ncbi:MAG: hypothetical protein ABR861_02745 [Terriglobales bacterium]|jgi:hypothetical protein
MISNADHRSVRALYGDFGNHYRFNRTSVLAADTLHRRQTTELVITSYDPGQGEESARAPSHRDQHDSLTA